MKAMRIALAGLALAGVCQGVWGSGGICTEHDANLVVKGRGWGAIERVFDKVFNGGAKAREIAEANRVCAVEDSVQDYCQNQIRRVADVGTLKFEWGSYDVQTTDSGFVVLARGSDHQRHYRVRCYASNSGQILRVLME